MTRMWVRTVYIISGLSLHLLIFSRCQRPFGDSSEQVSCQTRPCTKSEASHTGRCLAWTKKAHLHSRPYSKLCAPEGGKSSLSPGGSSLSRSGTGFWNSISNSALVHEMSTQMLKFFGMQSFQGVSSLRQCFADLSPCWLVQLSHICVPVPFTSFKCGWWHTGGTLRSSNFTANTSTISKVEKRSMVTQGTEMDTPQEKMSSGTWLQTSLVVLVYPRFKKKVSCWTDGNKVTLWFNCCWMLAPGVEIGTALERADSAKAKGFKIHLFLSNPQWGWWKGT